MHFSGREGEISAGGIFQGIIFHGVGSVQGVNFSGEILHLGNLTEFLYEILLADSILRVEMLRVIV